MQFCILERAGRACQLLPKGIWRKYYMMRQAGFFDTLFHLVSPDWCTLGASVLPCPMAHGTRLAWAWFIHCTSVEDNFQIFKASRQDLSADWFAAPLVCMLGQMEGNRPQNLDAVGPVVNQHKCQNQKWGCRSITWQVRGAHSGFISSQTRASTFSCLDSWLAHFPGR